MMTWSRLQQMTLDEVSCRGRQQANKWFDRVRPALGPAGEPRRPRVADDAMLPWSRFAAVAPRRFFHGAQRSSAERLIRRFPEHGQALVAAAEKVRRGRFDLLGYRDLDFGTPVDWHLDPVAGRRSSRVHWSRIDPLDSVQVGDSKVVWEINRHQWVVTLAQAAVITGDETFAEAAFSHLDHWCSENPYGIGINWASSLEVAVRLIAWCWVLMLLKDSSALTSVRFARLQRMARAHACHVERYLSYYFAPNTHLTGEALGLFYAGVLFADCADAARWRDRGRRILLQEIGRQVNEDGVYWEQASCYHRYTLEIYLHFLVLAGQNGVRVPQNLGNTLEQMGQWLISVSAPDKRTPAIGDEDGGWLLPLTPRQGHDSEGVLGLAASVLDSPVLAGPVDACPEVLWILGTEGLNRLESLRVRSVPAAPSTLFPRGGYGVMRSGWSADANVLLVDAGPLGCTASGAHGHADLLSVQCWAHGEPYLIDPGTYCYTADARWRDYFRSTAAHNTVRIDHQDQAVPLGPFGWRSRPAAKVRGWETTPHYDLLDVEHDAYGRLAPGLVHRRRVMFVKPEGWVLVDDITGHGRHHVELRFNFAPRPVAVTPDGWTRAEGNRGRGLWLRAMASRPLATELRTGADNPIGGWMSTSYGTLEPTPVVIYSAEADLPLRITTLILPAGDLASGTPAMTLTRDASGNVVSLRWPGDERVVHVGDEALTVTSTESDLRIA